MKKITNEQLCAVMLTTGSVEEAAEKLNVSKRTIYNMMSDNDYKMLYEQAQADILQNCVIICQNKTLEALDCIADIMHDKKVNAQTRLLAAQSIIKNSLIMYEATEKMRDKANEEKWNIL